MGISVETKQACATSGPSECDQELAVLDSPNTRVMERQVCPHFSVSLAMN